MKVAVYSPSVFNVKRGTETFVKSTCKLLGNYHRIHLVSGGGKGKYLAKNVRIYEYPYFQRNDMPNGMRSQFDLESATFFISASSHFKQHSYDLIHSHFPLDIALKSVTRDPLLLHVHGDPTGYKELLKSVKAEGYAACSYHIAGQLETIVGEPVHTVYNGVDPEVFKPKDGIDNKGKFIVLSIGSLGISKGIHHLIRAFKGIEKKSKDIHLWIGGKGPQEESLRNIKRKLGLRNVRFLGFVPQEKLPSIYSAADVFILPSHNEPFGITLLEALACGTPVIATDRGGPSEFVREEFGWLIEPQSANSIERAVLESKRHDLKAMGKAGRKAIKRNFTWECAVKSLLKVYRHSIK